MKKKLLAIAVAVVMVFIIFGGMGCVDDDYDNGDNGIVSTELGAFNLLPGNVTGNIDTLTPAFGWLPSANAESYTLEVSRTVTFTPAVAIVVTRDGITEPTSYELSAASALEHGTEYFWRVTAVRGEGENEESRINEGGPRSFRTPGDLFNWYNNPLPISNAGMQAGFYLGSANDDFFAPQNNHEPTPTARIDISYLADMWVASELMLDYHRELDIGNANAVSLWYYYDGYWAGGGWPTINLHMLNARGDDMAAELNVNPRVRTNLIIPFTAFYVNLGYDSEFGVKFSDRPAEIEDFDDIVNVQVRISRYSPGIPSMLNIGDLKAVSSNAATTEVAAEIFDAINTTHIIDNFQGYADNSAVRAAWSGNIEPYDAGGDPPATPTVLDVSLNTNPANLQSGTQSIRLDFTGSNTVVHYIFEFPPALLGPINRGNAISFWMMTDGEFADGWMSLRVRSARGWHYADVFANSASQWNAANSGRVMSFEFAIFSFARGTNAGPVNQLINNVDTIDAISITFDKWREPDNPATYTVFFDNFSFINIPRG